MCISHVYLGDAQENWVNLSEMAQVTTWYIIISWRQKKAVKGWGGQLWEVIRKSKIHKGKVVIQIKVIAFSTDEFREIWSSSSIWYIEEDTVTDGDFPFKDKYF